MWRDGHGTCARLFGDCLCGGVAGAVMLFLSYVPGTSRTQYHSTSTSGFAINTACFPDTGQCVCGTQTSWTTVQCKRIASKTRHSVAVQVVVLILVSLPGDPLLVVIAPVWCGEYGSLTQTLCFAMTDPSAEPPRDPLTSQSRNDSEFSCASSAITQ